jgi:rubredoxin
LPTTIVLLDEMISSAAGVAVRQTTNKVVKSRYSSGGRPMDKYQCNVCGYVYDPEIGDPTQNIPPGTSFEDLPDDWTCPECGASKDEFTKL